MAEAAEAVEVTTRVVEVLVVAEEADLASSLRASCSVVVY